MLECHFGGRGLVTWMTSQFLGVTHIIILPSYFSVLVFNTEKILSVCCVHVTVVIIRVCSYYLVIGDIGSFGGWFTCSGPSGGSTGCGSFPSTMVSPLYGELQHCMHEPKKSPAILVSETKFESMHYIQSYTGRLTIFLCKRCLSGCTFSVTSTYALNGVVRVQQIAWPTLPTARWTAHTLSWEGQYKINASRSADMKICRYQQSTLRWGWSGRKESGRSWRSCLMQQKHGRMHCTLPVPGTLGSAANKAVR